MNLPPVFTFQWTNASGPLTGGMLYSYAAGTSTPQATYTDQTGGTPNTNPVVLDANGSAPVWLDPTLSYKFVLTDASSNTIFTRDNVVGTLTANAVNSASIQNGAVTTAKLAANAVTSAILASDPAIDANRAVGTNAIQNGAVTSAKLDTSTLGASALNIGLTTSVASNAMTIALKGADGNDPSSTDVVKINFRNSASTTGTPVSRTVTTALSITIPNGATLGTVNSTADYIYIYAIDNAGVIELAVSANPLADEGSLLTTSAVSGGTSRGLLYTTTARSNVAVRLIGRALVNEATAGTWASNATEVSIFPFLSVRPSWSGYQTVTSGWTSTSSTYADLAAGTGVVLNQVSNTNFGSVTAASGSLPGITFTPTKTGSVYICANAGVIGSTASNIGIRMVDGTSNVINPGIGILTAAGATTSPVFSQICGIYTLATAGTPVTVKLQFATNAGTLSVNSTNLPTGSAAIYWSIITI